MEKTDSKVLSPDWDSHQLTVIQANSHERIIVDAGPGTGKTAIAIDTVTAHTMSAAG